MRRSSFRLALAFCALAASACGGQKSGSTASVAAKGVFGQYYFVATPAPMGGTITSGDGLINCGVGGSACGDAVFHQTKYLWAQTVTLTATADTANGYAFQSWGGDCSGSTPTCTLSAGADYTVVAVFFKAGPAAPVAQVNGRLYGYVKDGANKAAAGVTVTVQGVAGAVAATNAVGAFAIDVPPGTYTLTTTDGNIPALYTNVSLPGVVVPNVGDTGCVKSNAAVLSGNTNGCLVQQDLAVGNTGYVNPVTIAASASKAALVGFNQSVTLTCTPGGTGTFAGWTQTAGPTIVDTSAWTASGQSFTTPTLQALLDRTAAADADKVNCPMGAGSAAPNKVGCGVGNLYLEQRGGMLPITKQQAGELTYSFKCTAKDAGNTNTAAKTVSVQLASMVNTNYDHLPVDLATGTQNTSTRVYAPAGALVIMDDKAGRAASTWTITAVSPTPAFTGTINDAGTKNAWFIAPVQGRYTLKYDATVSIDLRVNNWGGYSTSCFTCHDPSTGSGPTEPVVEWQASKHNHIVIDGMGGTHYSSSCLTCHTVGYDANIANNGWDDVAAAQVPAYKLPDFTFLGSDATLAFASMPAPVQALSNVQCQSCHGAADGGTAHNTGSLNSRVCGYCHDGGHHGLYTQWRKSGHGNLAAAQNEGPNHGADQSHCARCHYAQGFLQYLPAVTAGNPDKLGFMGAAGIASVTIAPAGITADNVEPVSCQTCHQPHSLELRIGDADTSKAGGMLLAAGFSIQNAGAGGLCATCHNSRNGILGGSATVAGTPTQHNDATPLTSANFGMTAPHRAAQADVYYAGNGYLLGAAMPKQTNYHQDPNYFADTCAECHVKRFSTAAAAAGTVVNHLFDVDANTCVGCHGGGSELSMRQSLVANKIFAYQVKLAQVLNAPDAGITLVNGQLNGAVDTSVPPKPVLADYAIGSGVTITAAAVSGDRPLTLDLTFSNGDVLAGCNIDKIMSGATPTLYTVSGTVKTYGKVAKSMYNFALINNDNSAGVHNIPFVDAMLDSMASTNLESVGLPK